ncbi:MAG: alpha/beta hydrolase [Burkholderiales bacterium]|nr:alpha/beta hydrolase [Burkholderiales bacterium]
MPMVRVNGVELNVLQLDEGDGAAREDLVMVHGLATNMAFWYFKYAVPLSRRFRITLYDLRGHGRSEMPASGYAPEVLGRDLAALLDHLGIEKAHLMAHSFGGVVALNFACAQPQRVRSLVLADSHFSAGRSVHARAQWAFGRRVQPVLDRYGLDLDTQDPYFGPRLLLRVAEWQINGFEIPRELGDLVSPLLGRTGKRTAGEFLRLMRTTSAEREMTADDGLTLDRLRALRFPIVAMYGDNSPARLSGSELLEIWPHAIFRRVRDAGHFFPTVRPQQVLADCLRFWDGELDHAHRRQRAGESGRAWFRSDRVFPSEGGWYYTTRSEQRVGPFASREAAAQRLQGFLAEVAS